MYPLYLLIHTLVGLSAVVNAASSSGVQASVWMPAFSPFGFIPGSGIAGSYGDSGLDCLRNCRTVLHSGCTRSSRPGFQRAFWSLQGSDDTACTVVPSRCLGQVLRAFKSSRVRQPMSGFYSPQSGKPPLSPSTLSIKYAMHSHQVQRILGSLETLQEGQRPRLGRLLHSQERGSLEKYMNPT